MLQEADYGMTQMAMEGNSARFADDAKLLVRFFKHPRLNEGRSKEEGRPIYEEVDYVQIMQPGNKDSIVVRPATQMDKNRFAEHYRKYQSREGDYEAVDGTPLEEWPGISRSMVEELKFLNVRTVEQLAGMSDSNAQNIMGIQMLKTKAKAYLEAASDEAAAEALAEANAKVEEQNKLIEALAARLEALEASDD